MEDLLVINENDKDYFRGQRDIFLEDKIEPTSFLIWNKKLS